MRLVRSRQNRKQRDGVLPTCSKPGPSQGPNRILELDQRKRFIQHGVVSIAGRADLQADGIQHLRVRRQPCSIELPGAAQILGGLGDSLSGRLHACLRLLSAEPRLPDLELDPGFEILEATLRSAAGVPQGRGAITRLSSVADST